MTRTPLVNLSVSCVDVREARLRGTPLSEEASAHARNCPICSADGADGAVQELDELFRGIEGRLESERGVSAWLRSRPTPVRMLVAAGGVALLVAWWALATPRTLFSPIPVERVALVLAALAVLGALLLRLGLRPAQTPAPSDRLVLGGLAGGLLFPVVAAFLPAGTHHFDHYTQYTETQAAVGCFIIGALTGMVVVFLLRALDRAAHDSRPAALLAAVTGGVAGNLALEFHCPVTAPAHIILGHATVGLVLVLTYGLLKKTA